MLRGTDLHPGTGVQCLVLGWPLVNVRWEQLLQPGHMVSKNRRGTCQRGLLGVGVRGMLFSSSAGL